jgi:hypothetical protein
MQLARLIMEALLRVGHLKEVCMGIRFDRNSKQKRSIQIFTFL